MPAGDHQPGPGTTSTITRKTLGRRTRERLLAAAGVAPLVVSVGLPGIARASAPVTSGPTVAGGGSGAGIYADGNPFAVTLGASR